MDINIQAIIGVSLNKLSKSAESFYRESFSTVAIRLTSLSLFRYKGTGNQRFLGNTLFARRVEHCPVLIQQVISLCSESVYRICIDMHLQCIIYSIKTEMPHVDTRRLYH